MNKTIGEKLREKRINDGITQITLAERMGCTSSYISAVELGDSKPSDDFRKKLISYIEEQNG